MYYFLQLNESMNLPFVQLKKVGCATFVQLKKDGQKSDILSSVRQK